MSRVTSCFVRLILAIVAVICASMNPVQAQAPTTGGGTVSAYTDALVTFPARSNFGKPGSYQCYNGTSGICPGGTDAPATPIRWIVDGVSTPTSTGDRFGGVEPHTCTYVAAYDGSTQSANCPNYYATATLTISFTPGTHTVTAYISANGGFYDSDPYAAFSTTWNVTVTDQPPPPQPHLVSLSANTAGQGELLTLTGDTFGTTQAAVYIGNLIAPVQPQSWTDTSIQVQVPGNLPSGGVFVTVNAGGQTSNGVALTITGPPTPSSVLCTPDLNAPAASAGMTKIYHFCVPQSAAGQGYAADGNLLTVSDSVNGDWAYGYDSLNRLRNAYALPNGPYGTLTLDMGYDSFGNRTRQTAGTTGGNSNLPTVPSWAQSYDGNNRLTSGNVSYDPSGSVTFDGTNQIAYDADGNVCAVWNANSGASWVTQYLYDAEGRRTAKGHSQANPMTLACTDGGSDFVVTASYGLGLSGELISEFDGNNAWKHSNVFADGKLLATYDSTGLHYHLTDHLGTARLQYSSDNSTVELQCRNLPFGDTAQGAPPCTGPHATENFFTGKERDTESGLDYFGARYYQPLKGLWASPDPGWFISADLANPQSLNQYVYALSNPVNATDPTGLDPCYGPPDSHGVVNVVPCFDKPKPNPTPAPNPNPAPVPKPAPPTPNPDPAPDQAPSWHPGLPFPENPSGLGSDWGRDWGHKSPNDERWKNGKTGDKVDWHPGIPGANGWEGKDHWHWIPGESKEQSHYHPGQKIKMFAAEHRKALLVTVGVIGIAATILTDGVAAPAAIELETIVTTSTLIPAVAGP